MSLIRNIVFITVSITVYAKELAYLGIYEPEQNSDDNINRAPKIRVPFIWENGQWYSMPNAFSDPKISVVEFIK